MNRILCWLFGHDLGEDTNAIGQIIGYSCRRCGKNTREG